MGTAKGGNVRGHLAVRERNCALNPRDRCFARGSRERLGGNAERDGAKHGGKGTKSSGFVILIMKTQYFAGIERDSRHLKCYPLAEFATSAGSRRPQGPTLAIALSRREGCPAICMDTRASRCSNSGRSYRHPPQFLAGVVVDELPIPAALFTEEFAIIPINIIFLAYSL